MSGISVSLASPEVVLDGPATVTASVTNDGPVPERVVLDAFASSGPAGAGAAGGGAGDPGWVTVERPLREVAAGATEQYAVALAAPGAAAGTYQLKLIAYPAAAAPEEYADRGQVLRVVVPAADAPPPPRRRWWPWVLGAVLLVLAVAAVVWFLTRPDVPAAEEPRPTAEVRAAATRVTASVDVGSSLDGLAVDPTGGRLYVPSAASGALWAVDVAPPHAVEEVPLGELAAPVAVAMDVPERRLYVGDGFGGAFFGGLVHMVHVGPGLVVDTGPLTLAPVRMAVDSESGLVYVSTDGGSLDVVDTETMEVTRTILVGSAPRGVAVGGDSVYVALQGDDAVAVVDRSTLEVTGVVAVGQNPSGVALDPASGHLYVADVLGDTVSVVDPATRRVVATIDVGINPEGVAADPEARVVYVTSSGGSVAVIDTRTNEVVDEIDVEGTPRDIVVDTSTGTVFVTDASAGTVLVLGP